MKQYLKMADVFVHDSVEELEQHIYAGYMSKHCSEYAAHAINSHDELVSMNRELLEALELVINDKAPSYHDCIDDGESECAWCVARKAITKVRGE